MNSREDRGRGYDHDDESSRNREEERFRPGYGAEGTGARSRGGRVGGSSGDGYRSQGTETGAFGNPGGGGYGEYNWERGGDYGRAERGREDYNRWGDETGRQDMAGRDYRDYGRDQGRESGYGRGQGSMGSEGYRSGGWGAGYGGSGAGGYGGYGGGYGSARSEGAPETGSYASSRYGLGSPSGYGAEGYRSHAYGSPGQQGSEQTGRGRDTSGHYGKGPMGYTRSDERIRDEVSDRLTEDSQVDASRLTVKVSSGEVTLEGSVDDRRMKRKAEDVAEGVMGVKQVHNQLRVEPDQGAGAQTTQPSGTGTTTKR